MNSAQVDTFSSRLNNELSALDARARADLLVRIGRMELKMRADGQERPTWNGPLDESRILGADVVVPTDQGERRGRVICFGVVQTGALYERSVIVHVPSSGTQHEAPGSQARLASPEDTERIKNELEMAARLNMAADIANRAPKYPEQAMARAKKRGLKDPKLIERMLKAAADHGRVRAIEEGSTNHKVVGADGNRRIYVFKNQLRVDISGVTVDHPSIRKISEEEAKDMHLGKVRGQLLFDDREAAFDGFVKALDHLG